MKRTLVPKIINKTNLLENSIINEGKYNKNSILKHNIRSIDKRHNDSLTNNKFKSKIIDRGMHTRQNSNKLIEAINNTQRNYSNKKLFFSNSYKKREKINKINEINNNKIINTNTGNNKLDISKTNSNFKHKKLFSLQTNLINDKKNNNTQHNIEINKISQKINANINKQNVINNKYKDFFSLINKDKKNKLKNKKINNSIFNNYIHNISTNKSSSQHNKIINRSMEQRNKTKIKLSQNIKTKIKNKMDKKESMKTENIFNKEFIINNNDYNYTQRNKPPSKIEICQTFSKDETVKDNINTNESNKNMNINTNNNNKKIKNDKLLKINTTYQYLKYDNLKPKTSTSKENKKLLLNNKEKQRTPMASKSMEKYHKLKKLIGEYCISNDTNKNNKSSISIKPKTKKYNSRITSINKNNFTTGNIIQKELKGIKQYINSYNMKKNINLFNLNYLDNYKNNTGKLCSKDPKIKNNDIFEVISDIKVKSLNEYQEEKKADKNTIYNTSPNDNKINNNININININYNNININNQINNDSNIKKQYNSDINNVTIENKTTNLNINNGVFIEDRDEYNILKETFSKDRFSFRPISGDNNEIKTNFQQYNNVVNTSINKNNLYELDNISLNRNDFINNDNINNINNINNDIIKNNINNKNIDNKKIMKKEISKIQKLKKIIKNKQTSKLLKPENSLNKSVELRFKKNK